MRVSPFATCRWFRLAAYLLVLDAQEQSGAAIITSTRLAGEVGVSPALVRKDMLWLRRAQAAEWGRPGVGYSVAHVRHALQQFMGATQPLGVALAGPPEIAHWVGTRLQQATSYFYPVAADEAAAALLVVLAGPAPPAPASRLTVHWLTRPGAESAGPPSRAKPAPPSMDVNLSLLLLAALACLAGGTDETAGTE